MSADMEVDKLVEEVDSFKFEFDELEAVFQSSSSSDREQLIPRYENYLTSIRDDEDAVRIKETAIYRLTRYDFDENYRTH